MVCITMKLLQVQLMCAVFLITALSATVIPSERDAGPAQQVMGPHGGYVEPDYYLNLITGLRPSAMIS